MLVMCSSSITMDAMEPAKIHIHEMRISCAKICEMQMRICRAIKITCYYNYCDST